MEIARNVLIVGAGIAGLAAARALAFAGAEVTVVEQAPHWRPVGAGIILAPNALAVLDRIGVGASVRDLGRHLSTVRISDHLERALVDVRHGASLVAVHRAQLHDALLDGLVVDIRMGTTIDALNPMRAPPGSFSTGARTEVALSDGSTCAFDTVVGADGMRSTVRSLVLGEAAAPVVPAGYDAWRVVTDDPSAAREVVQQWGHGRRIGTVPLAGDRRYSFYVEPAAAGNTEAAGRTPHDTVGSLQSRFSEFRGPGRDALDDLDETSPPLHHTIARLSRVAYGRGNVVLIGDAAHGMTPDLGQGAAQALEDVPALLEVLRDDMADMAGALADRRRRRAQVVMRLSAAVGRVGQVQRPVPVALRNGALRLAPTAIAERVVAAVGRPAAAR